MSECDTLPCRLGSKALPGASHQGPQRGPLALCPCQQMVLLIPSPNLIQLIRKPTPSQVEPFQATLHRLASCVTVSTWVPFLPVWPIPFGVGHKEVGSRSANYSARKGCSWNSFH